MRISHAQPPKSLEARPSRVGCRDHSYADQPGTRTKAWEQCLPLCARETLDPVCRIPPIPLPSVCTCKALTLVFCRCLIPRWLLMIREWTWSLAGGLPRMPCESSDAHVYHSMLLQMPEHVSPQMHMCTILCYCKCRSM